MKIRLLLFSALAAVLSVFCISNPASAHSLDEDTNTGIQAVLHITPDDSPIAGKESILSYHFDKTDLDNDFSVILTIKPTKGEAVTSPTDVKSGWVYAHYTFPSQGFYNITLTLKNKADGSVSKLQDGRRVSRGVINQQNENMFGPFEIGAVAGAIFILMGAIVITLVNNRRKK